MNPERVLGDTSLFIGLEQRRIKDVDGSFPVAVSVITVGELQAGVLAAGDLRTRAMRLRTLGEALSRNPLPVDQRVADAWAELRMALRAEGRRMPINDSWIAATAIAHDLPVMTQDDDYDGVPALRVLKI